MRTLAVLTTVFLPPTFVAVSQNVFIFYSLLRANFNLIAEFFSTFNPFILDIDSFPVTDFLLHGHV
jgi:hypothetical protein